MFALLLSIASASEMPAPRVVLLDWPQGQVSSENAAVRKRVARIVEGSVVGPQDLAQQGRIGDRISRKELDDHVLAMTAIPAVALQPKAWGAWFEQGVDLLEQAPVVEDVETRESLWALHLQLARAEELAGLEPEPVKGTGSDRHVWAAARLAQDWTPPPGLPDALELAYVQALSAQKQDVATMTLAFDVDDVFDAQAFVSEFLVKVDGVEVVITNPEGTLVVPVGLSQVSLRRIDGHSLTAVVEHWEPGTVTQVVEEARDFGNSLVETLVRDLSACEVPLDEAHAESVMAYEQLSPRTPLYIALPIGGKAKGTRIWRHEQGVLESLDCLER